MSEQFFFARHTDRPDKSDSPESQQYEWITEKGVEIAQKAAKNVVEMVEAAAADAVIFIGGSTEEQRTKSTAQVIGDALAVKYAEDPNVTVLTYSQIESLRKAEDKPEEFKILNEVKRILDENADKKVVIDYPLFLKGFSLRPHFRDQSGVVTELSRKTVNSARQEYAEELANVDTTEDPNLRMKEEEAAGAKVYMKMQDTDEAHALGGQTPQEYAEAQLRDINRLRTFVKNQVGGRETVVGFVGHAWTLDALAAYLANSGEANYEGFQETGERMIQLAEMGKVVINEEEAVLTYRGEDYNIPTEMVNLRRKE